MNIFLKILILNKLDDIYKLKVVKFFLYFNLIKYNLPSMDLLKLSMWSNCSEVRNSKYIISKYRFDQDFFIIF